MNHNTNTPDISDLARYTVCLYRERFQMPNPVGTGILVEFYGKHYLLSAFHVFDMEDERLRIENDPDENDIPQDDMDSIMARGSESFFYIDNKMKALVFEAHYDELTAQPIFSDDVEWSICELDEVQIMLFHEDGKSFFKITEMVRPEIEKNAHIVIAGFPGYAQKVGQEGKEVYRSYLSEFIEDSNEYPSALFRANLDNDKAFNFELHRYVEIPKDMGISGMSGGGLWYKVNDGYIPLGIILQQNPKEHYIEGIYIDKILESILKENI